MNIKKASLLLVSLVLLLALFANSSFAAEEGSQSLAGAFDSIRKLFAFLPEMITMEKLLAGDSVATFWAKFLIWVGLFAVIYFGASFVFRQNPRIAVIVALVISLMGALMIPADIVASIFQTYGLLAAIIVWIAPVLAGFFLAHQVQHRLVKAVIYLLALIVLTLINGTTLTTDAWNISLPYFTLLWAVVLILFLFNLFAGFGDLGIGPGAGGLRLPGLGGIFRGAGEELEDAARAGRGLVGGRREAREATQRQRQAQEQLDSIQNLRQRLTETEARLQQYIQDPDIRQRFNNIAVLLIQLREVQHLLDQAENEIIGLARG